MWIEVGVTCRLQPGPGSPGAGDLRTAVTQSPSGFQMTGAWSHVPGAAGAKDRSLPWVCDCATGTC